MKIVLFCLSPLLAWAADSVPGRLLYEIRPGADRKAAEQMLNRLARSHGKGGDQGHVHQAEIAPEIQESVRKALDASGLFAYVEPDYYAEPAAAPDDPSFVNQWSLTTIQAPGAWDLSKGAGVIAILDSGIDAAHADLKPVLTAGWSFYKNSADTADLNGHGTAVAGVAAAATNNLVGVAGVAWGARIMPLAIADTRAYATYSAMANAIRYAADHEVRVINLSYGGTSPSSTLQSAVDYAWNKGAVVFASAMNANTSTLYYPAACRNVVAVAATDRFNNKASWSNYGSHIAIAAPGASILTTSRGGGYGYWSGTSFAAPITAGIANLMLAARPELTATELVTVLIQTATDLGAPGFDPYYGAGLVNARKAIETVRYGSFLPRIVP
jgi:subtilisin family serine protease